MRPTTDLPSFPEDVDIIQATLQFCNHDLSYCTFTHLPEMRTVSKIRQLLL